MEYETCIICQEALLTTDELQSGIHASCDEELRHCPFCGEVECVCFDDETYTVRGTARAARQHRARHGMRVDGAGIRNPVFRSSI